MYFTVFSMLFNPVWITADHRFVTAYTIPNYLWVFRTSLALISSTRLSTKISHGLPPHLQSWAALGCLAGPIPPPPSRRILSSALNFARIVIGLSQSGLP